MCYIKVSLSADKTQDGSGSEQTGQRTARPVPEKDNHDTPEFIRKPVDGEALVSTVRERLDAG